MDSGTSVFKVQVLILMVRASSFPLSLRSRIFSIGMESYKSFIDL